MSTITSNRPRAHSDADSDTSEDIDALFDSLDSAHDAASTAQNGGAVDPALSALRERRLNDLSQALARAHTQKSLGFGTVTTLDSDQAVLDLTTAHTRALVHFFHTNFARCKTMDRHLDALAARHLETKFGRIDVEKAPFVVGKLGVRVLPCVIGFVDGVGVPGGPLVGFEGLKLVETGQGKHKEDSEDFETGQLERVLRKRGMLEAVDGPNGLVGAKAGSGAVRDQSRADAQVNADDDDDWD